MVEAHKLSRSVILSVLLATSLACGAAWASTPRDGTQCWIDNGALVAPAAFGDIAGDFLIDLSTPVSMLHDTRARLDGIEATFVTRDLLFAGRTVAAVPMVVANLDSRTRDFATVINGVVGADVLSRFVVEIDVSPCRIRLTPWTARRRGERRRRRATRLAVAIVGGRPLAEARITDGVGVSSGLFALDTASWPTTLFGDRLSRQPPATGAPPLIRLRAMTLGGRLFEQIPAEVFPLDARDAASEATLQTAAARGAIGLSVLSGWRLRLDMHDGWIELLPAELKKPGPLPVRAHSDRLSRG